MGFFSWFNSESRNDEQLADSLADVIIITTLEEAERFGKILVVGPISPFRLQLECELSFILISVADRFALGKFGEPRRSRIIKSVVNQIKERMLPKGSNADEYEKLLAGRLEEYGVVQGLTGEHSLHSVGGLHLLGVGTLRMPNAILETGKELANCLSSVVSSPPFKKLLG